ncbi:MAG: CRISPR-associated endonuclease Cas1 [Gammaproteobacteria bacterium]|nr:CRISPR-associated endonuclease Cas1 [Gammaproteobacteria bacterium]
MPLELSKLFPLYYLQISLEFTKDTRFPFLHRYVLAGFVRHLLNSPNGFSQYLRLDAVENARLDYQQGDGYHFGLICLNGGEDLLVLLLEKLQNLPQSAPFSGAGKPFSDNLKLVNITNIFNQQAVQQFIDIEQINEQAFNQKVKAFNWNNALDLQWLSPVRIKKSNASKFRGEAKYCADADDLPADKLFYHLYNNLATVLNTPSNKDQINSLIPAAHYQCQHCFWIENSAKNTHKNPTSCGGMLGKISIHLNQPLDFSWQKILFLTQFIGMGNLYSYGWGRYQLSPKTPRATPAQSLLAKALSSHNLKNALTHCQQRLTPAQQQNTEIPNIQQLQINSVNYQAPNLTSWHKSKSDGSMRLMATPPFFDRVLQRAVSQIITPVLDKIFYQHSYGYRAKRSRQQVMQLIKQEYRQGYRWVFESDIDDFFEVISWARIEQRLVSIFGNDLCIDLIMKWVKADLDFGKHYIQRTRGLPQGAPISPILANLILDDFDNDMQKAGFRLIRFADDFVVLAKDKKTVEQAQILAKNALAEHGFELHPDKTKIIHQDEGYKYLGYLFLSDKVFTIKDKKALPNHTQALTKSTLRNLPQPLAEFQTKQQHAIIQAPLQDPLQEPQNASQKGSFIIVSGSFTKLNTLSNHLQISQHDELLATPSWQQINAILIIGKHHLSTPVLYQAMQKSVPIYFLSRFGNYQGELNAANHLTEHKDLHLKQAQYFSQASHCLILAQTIVLARAYSQLVVLRQKFKNQNTLPPQIKHIESLLPKIQTTKTLAQINGFEGKISVYYFQAIRTTLDKAWHFNTRNRQPPKDGFNVLLSLGYTCLYAYTQSLLRISGLSPYLGFYHQQRGTHAVLASDLMEPLRYIVERVAMRMINLGQIKTTDFSQQDGKIILDNAVRKAYLSALFSRLNQPFIAKSQTQPLDVFNHLYNQNKALIACIYDNEKHFTPFSVK